MASENHNFLNRDLNEPRYNANGTNNRADGDHVANRNDDVRFPWIWNSRPCRFARTCFSVIAPLYGLLFNGRSQRFYCVCSVVGGIVVFLGLLSIIGLLVGYFKAYSHSRSFVSLENHSFSLTDDAYSSNSNLEACLHKCRKRQSCVAVLFDPAYGKKRCSWYVYSPFYLDLQPASKQGAHIFITRRSLLSGMHMEDGYYYWLTPSAVTASEAELHCELHSDFYSLAIENPSTKKILDERMLPILRVYAGPDAKVIMWRVHEIGMNTSFLMKSVIRVGDSVEYVGDGEEGFGLCQGDPFNKEGHAPLKRRSMSEPETLFTDQMLFLNDLD